jgi:hypothetical protein
VPAPYDSVISIGGQSFVDGVWRLLGPALEGLTNPLPVAIPGLTNARMRVTQMVPQFPGTLPPGGALQLRATAELTAEALVQAAAPTVVTGVQVPTVIPVALDLTPVQSLELDVRVELAVAAPAAATRFALMFTVQNVTTRLAGGPDLERAIPDALNAAVARTRAQLGVASPVAPYAPPAIATLARAIAPAVETALRDALTRLVAETGRLIFPAAAEGASCDVRFLPTAADAGLTPASDGTYVLQLGFNRPGTTDTGPDRAIAALPAITPPAATDCTVLVGNRMVLDLLCCLVQRLPAFSFPVAPAMATSDVNGNGHTLCCNFTGVTAIFGAAAITGKAGEGISVCIDGASGGEKTFRIIGHFTQTIQAGLNLAHIVVDFSLPVKFDLDDAAALADLRIVGVPEIDARVLPDGYFLVVFGALFVALVLLMMGPLTIFLGVAAGAAAVAVLVFVVAAICSTASFLLDNAVGTVLGGASLLRSPAALPPGMFEAFGRFAPARVTVDELTAVGVLHTPTSPWTLLPRLRRMPALTIPHEIGGIDRAAAGRRPAEGDPEETPP